MEKVRLKRNYLDKRSNRWVIGNYFKEQLPLEIRNDPTYVVPLIPDNSNIIPAITVPKANEIKFKLDDAKKTDSLKHQQLINLNTATLEELTNIKGIGEKTANNIIEKRPFKDFEDFKNQIHTPTMDIINFDKIIII